MLTNKSMPSQTTPIHLQPIFIQQTAEGDPFALEMRIMSISTEAETTETMSREHRKEPSEVTIPFELKETKIRGRPRKEQKISGRSHH